MRLTVADMPSLSLRNFKDFSYAWTHTYTPWYIHIDVFHVF